MKITEQQIDSYFFLVSYNQFILLMKCLGNIFTKFSTLFSIMDLGEVLKKSIDSLYYKKKKNFNNSPVPYILLVSYILTLYI